MRRFTVSLLFVACLGVLVAQDEVTPPTATQDQNIAVPQIIPPAPQPASTPSAIKADALLLYKQGRDLEAMNKKNEATAKYLEAIVICDKEIAQDSTRMDSYTVKCWCLFRLERYRQVVDVGLVSLKVKFDARIVEVMGESYYYLADDANALKYLQRYIDNVGEFADRVPSAYFFMAESYLRQKRYDHADIAYSFAVYREANIPRWWYRYASVVETLGEYKRAYDLYARALKLSPGLKEASDAMARVKAKI